MYAGNPALELVNTLDDRFTDRPVELLTTYADLLRFVVQSGLLSAHHARRLARAVTQEESVRVLASAVELREALSAVLYSLVDGASPASGQVAVIEKHIRAAAGARRLQPGQPRLQWQWLPAEYTVETPLWMLAQAAADLLVSPEASLIRACGVPTCRWLFLDISKNHTRRWCDMKTCGNREKARRHQARQQP